MTATRLFRSVALTSLTLGLFACSAAPRNAGAPPAANMAGAAEEADGEAPSEPGAPAPAATAPITEVDGAPGSRGGAEMPIRKPSRGVKAGEWDDNANYREYLRYLSAR